MTGIRSKAATPAYREGFDRVFGRKPDAAKLFEGARGEPTRCGGKGYHIGKPDEPGAWDVDVVRWDCPGCPDCQRRKP